MMFDEREIQLLAASISVVAICLFVSWKKLNVVKDGGKRYPPSMPILPIFGAMFRGGMTVLPDHFMKSTKDHGPIFSFTIGKRSVNDEDALAILFHSMVVVLNGYDAIFDALIKHSEAFADRIPLWTEEKILNSELRGIAYTHYNETYKKYHKLILSILKEFGFGVHSVSETRILQEVETMNEEIMKYNSRPFYPKWPFTFAASNVITSILLGKDFQQSLPKVHSALVKNSSGVMECIDMAINMVPIVRFLPMFWKKIDGLRKHGKLVMAAIEVGIEFIKSNNSEPTFVGRFLEIEGTNYDHQELLYIVRDLVFGSTDTVSTTLQWAIVELANHSEIQNCFQREIDEMVPRDTLPSLDDKPRLPYTEAVILEILRRRTIGPFMIPHGTLKDTKVLDYDVPEGSLIIPNCYSVHMVPDVWKDPENFRPERFLDKDKKIINSQRITPFGLGKRSCTGEIIARQSVFLILTSLVQRFDIRPPEGQNLIKVKEVTAITMAPSHFEVRLIPRVKPTQRQS